DEESAYPDFCHLHSLMVTMSQKSSNPQAVKSVSQVLMLDKSDAKSFLLPDFYSGRATRIPGRLTEGLLLRRLHKSSRTFVLPGSGSRSARKKAVLIALTSLMISTFRKSARLKLNE
ncbi:MAG: hypothetical protein P8Y71_22540, partial [Pseudolabrys sp.]